MLCCMLHGYVACQSYINLFVFSIKYFRSFYGNTCVALFVWQRSPIFESRDLKHPASDIKGTHNIMLKMHIITPFKICYCHYHKPPWTFCVPCPLPYLFQQLRQKCCTHDRIINCPDRKVHGANMGPIWGRQDPRGPHVGPMNFAIWVVEEWTTNLELCLSIWWLYL